MASTSDPAVFSPPPHVRPSGGRLVGVGVGPGDPELLTLQAVRTLERADRVVAPTTALDAPGRAEMVVRAVLPHLLLQRIPFSMASPDEPEGARSRLASHQAAASVIAQWLDQGEEVAFVTLGDPNLYSTFSSVAQAVREMRPNVALSTVPGICAFQVLAARSGTVLLDGTESLSLVTALDGTSHVKEAIAQPQRAVVVYKGGRHLPEVASLLADCGRLEGAVVGELLGLPGERVTPLADAAGAPGTYLATIVVPPSSRANPAGQQGP